MSCFKKKFLYAWLFLLLFQSSCVSIKKKGGEEKKCITNMYLKNGYQYYDNKQYDKAIIAFSHVIKLNPNSSKIYCYRASTYYHIKQYKKAIKDFSYAIKINPDSYKIYDSRGWAYFCIKQYKKAFADFSHAIKINPNSYKIYDSRGRAYFYLKQYYKAIRDFSHAIKLNPNSYKIYDSRGWAYFYTKQYNKSIQDFSISHGSDAYFGKAMTYSELEQYDKAINNYSQAIKIELKQSNKGVYYLSIMEICIIADKLNQFNNWLKQFEKNIPEKKVSKDNLIIKLYLILVNKCVMNELRTDIEKRLNALLKDKGDIVSNWSFSLTNKWLSNSKNNLTLKQIKYIRDLTEKINTAFGKNKRNKNTLNNTKKRK